MLMFVEKVRKGGEGWRYPLPEEEAASLLRWRDGRGAPEDRERVRATLERARRQNVWLGCGCGATGEAAPLLAVVRTRAGDRYHLRRMLGPGRSRHAETCSWAALTLEVREGRGPRGRAGGQPVPGEARPLPRLAGALNTLLVESGVTVRCAEEARPSIASELAAIRRIARRFEFNAGEPLGDLYADHVDALRSGELLGRLLKAEDKDASPVALACLFARRVGERSLGLADGSELELEAPVVWGQGGLGAGGPFLVLVRCERGSDGLVAREAVAQPILSGRRLMPVESDLDRRGMEWLLRLQWSLHRAGLAVRLERPIYSLATPAGECRASALVWVPATLGETIIAVRIGVGPVAWEEDRARLQEVGHPFRLGLRELDDPGAMQRLRRLCFALHRAGG